MDTEYTSYISKVLGLSKATCTQYQYKVLRFEDYCRSRKSSIQDADEAMITAFIDSLTYATNTKYLYLCAIKSYCRYLVYSEQISSNPASRIRSPQDKSRTRSACSIEDIVRLIHAIETDTPVGIRNRAIIELLYATGMRASEISHLCLYDIDLENRTLKIFGKGSKERLMPLNDFATSILQHYLKHRHRLVSNPAEVSSFLFISAKNQGRSLTTQSIWKMIKRYAKKADLGQQITTHSLRHAFATHMLQNGANLRVVQQLLGHSNIETTQLYTHFENQHLKELHQKHHPRA